jgi:PDZ domain-containing protein/PEGA domain-containing protein
VTARAGETATVTLELERVTAVLHILSAPPDVDVLFNGKRVGRTPAGPPASDYADVVSRAGADAAAVSGALIIPDVPPGAHTLELGRDCLVRVSTPVTIEKPDDIVLGPVVLKPAVATLVVQASEPGAQVFVDGKERGAVPFTTTELCEGEHLVELRTPHGRDSRRVTARAGDKIAIDGVIKPTFTLVSSSSEAGAPDADMRAMVERAFAPTRTMNIVAAPAAESDKALKAIQLPAGWLAVDLEGRFLGPAIQITPPARSDAANKLASTFGAQGIGSITMLDRNRLTLSLLAAGSAVPDVLDVRLDRPESVASAIERLDQLPTFVRPTLGLVAIDVADLAGAAVVGVDANGPAAAAKVQPGDLIVSASGQSVADASALAKVVADHTPGSPMTLELRDSTGATRRVETSAFLAPRLIGLSDQTVLVNRLLVHLRARLAAATDPFEQSIVRLNTAVALGRIGDWNAARELLKQVQLPDRPGVGNGTVQYLLGIAAQELGNRAEAEMAFKAAAATGSLLTEDGPPVRELAEQRLAQLQRGN